MDYLKADFWYVREAAILLLGGKPINDDGVISSEGVRPLRPGEPERLKDLCELTYRAMDAGALPFVGKRKNAQVRPADFARWAAEKGYAVPDDWGFNDKSIEAADDEPLPDDELISDKTAEAEPLSDDEALPGKGPIDRRRSLGAIIGALKEIDSSLEESKMPGRVEDFLRFCNEVDFDVFSDVSVLQFRRTSIKGWLRFKSGAGKVSYYHDRVERVREKLSGSEF